MGLKRVIRQGDTTTHGGIVLEGVANFPIHGKSAAVMGNMVRCPKCKGTFPIVAGAKNFPIMGKYAAVEGMKTACGAVLIASQDVVKIKVPDHMIQRPPPPPIAPKADEIEIIVSDSIAISSGSQFGHTAIDLDGTVYGRAVRAWDVDTKTHYLYRQQDKMNRNSWGYVIKVTLAEKAKIIAEAKKKAKHDKPYSIVSNSCSSAMNDLLVVGGVDDAIDPRWIFGAIAPRDLMRGLTESKRLVRINQ